MYLIILIIFNIYKLFLSLKFYVFLGFYRVYYKESSMSRGIAKSQHTIAIVCGNRLRLRMARRYTTPHVLALLDNLMRRSS
jgi:hypothetical protein